MGGLRARRRDVAGAAGGRRPADIRARARDLLLVLLAQGAVGYVQYFTHVPEGLVTAHMPGSA